MSRHFTKETAVKWKWGNGYGVVKEIFERDVQRTIDGEKIIRHGTKENPAYEIERKEGNNVLKLHSELEKDG